MPNPNVFNKHEYIVGENFRANTEGTFGYDTVAKLWRYNDGIEKSIIGATPPITDGWKGVLDQAGIVAGTVTTNQGIGATTTVAFANGVTFNNASGIFSLPAGDYIVTAAMTSLASGDFSISLEINGNTDATSRVLGGGAGIFPNVTSVVFGGPSTLIVSGFQNNGGINPWRARVQIIRVR
jgi:hypothetical protein